MKKTGKIILLGLFLAMFMFIKMSKAEQSFAISGSTTLEPVTNAIAEIYEEKYGEEINIDCVGSSVGIKDAISGKSLIGAASRSIKPEEKAQLKYTTVAYDALAIIVNKNSKVQNITKQQLIDIYSGKVKNWQGLTNVISFTKRHGTYAAFEEHTGLKGKIPNTIRAIDTQYEILEYVSQTPNAIAYVSLGHALPFQKGGGAIKVLSLDGVKPSFGNVKNGTYTFVRELNYVYKAKTDKVQKFLTIVASPEGKKVITDNGFMPR